jgi:hypothetical protein
MMDFHKVLRWSNLTKGKAKLISQQTDKISQQLENWENRNSPDLVQALPKKWWVESDITVPNSQGYCGFPSFPVVD